MVNNILEGVIVMVARNESETTDEPLTLLVSIALSVIEVAFFGVRSYQNLS